ncbi:hypothetical protein M5585_17110 [Serratia ureilytica]
MAPANSATAACPRSLSKSNKWRCRAALCMGLFRSKSIKQQYTAENSIREAAMMRTEDQTSFRLRDDDEGITHNNQER